jgi:muramoyltetrapeptide carboxypeptidase LdcA involved in peptidoglycan recycling
MIPPKLRSNDQIQVVSPATSLAYIPAEQRQTALERLRSIGLSVSFSKHAEEHDRWDSSPVELRVADLHAAFADPQVKGMMTTLGGYNANQLLRSLDWDLVAANPKVFCGYSDITVLSNAIYAKTGVVTYSGPHFSTFSMVRGIEYTLEYFTKCVMDDAPFALPQAPTWSDDAWYADQEARTFVPNAGYLVINEGEAEGTLLGGHLNTLGLLHGTDYMPDLEGSIVLIEADEETKAQHFDRELQSLLHQPGFADVQGLIIGRFQRESSIDDATLIEIVRSKRELAHLPVVGNASFGHTTPQFTFPVGGRGTLRAVQGQAEFVIVEH